MRGGVLGRDQCGRTIEIPPPLTSAGAESGTIALGGLIGGIFGGLGMWANLKVARSALHPAVQALVMIIVVGAAYVVWSIVAVAIRSMLAA